MPAEAIINILVVIPGLLLGIVFHEVAHGWMADRLGDQTARMVGRLSLNPLRHLDPWGTVLLPLFLLLLSKGSMVFGYAKPVPINLRNLRNLRRDVLLISLAGPAANLLTAIAVILLAWVARFSGWLENPGLREVAYAAMYINILLAAFNLLPLPPLDGAEIVASLLPEPWSRRFQQLAPYSFLIFMVLYFTGLLGVLLIPITQVIRILLIPLGNPFA
ncbi:MAG: site-2 protease family protein [candidate division FCPU426 bacterium]